MIKIEKEFLPKEYERAIIEEYYKMYRDRDGFPQQIRGDVRYTADFSHLRKKDLRNQELMKAINAYTSIENSDIEFICYGEDEVITAVARIMKHCKNLHIIDMIFLYYPTLAEKCSYIKNLLDAANCYAYQSGCETISCEVAKNDGIAFDILSDLGYSLTPDLEKESRNYPTYILERQVFRRDGQTRSRK